MEIITTISANEFEKFTSGAFDGVIGKRVNITGAEHDLWGTILGATVYKQGDKVALTIDIPGLETIIGHN